MNTANNLSREQQPFNFEESESVRMVREMARDFAEKHIRPHFMEWDFAKVPK